MNQPELLTRLKQGDSSVFSDLVELGKDMVYNTALGIVQNEEDAEDITQEVFITLYEKVGDFREEAKLSTWLYRITVHKSLDHEKKKKRQKNGGMFQRIFALKEKDEPALFVHPGVVLDNKERAAFLFAAIKKLPEQQRIAFTLHKLEGLSNLEIAEVMKISSAAAASLQTRATTNLRKFLQVYVDTDL